MVLRLQLPDLLPDYDQLLGANCLGKSGVEMAWGIISFLAASFSLAWQHLGMNDEKRLFKNSKIGSMTRYGDEGHGTKGTVMTATFQLDGQNFMALNGGPEFVFS